MTKLTELLETKPPEMPDHPPCAFCGSENTEFMALFGQFLLVSQYYCHTCHSAFEWCKWQGEGENVKREEDFTFHISRFALCNFLTYFMI